MRALTHRRRAISDRLARKLFRFRKKARALGRGWRPARRRASRLPRICGARARLALRTRGGGRSFPLDRGGEHASAASRRRACASCAPPRRVDPRRKRAGAPGRRLGAQCGAPLHARWRLRPPGEDHDDALRARAMGHIGRQRALRLRHRQGAHRHRHLLRCRIPAHRASARRGRRRGDPRALMHRHGAWLLARARRRPGARAREPMRRRASPARRLASTGRPPSTSIEAPRAFSVRPISAFRRMA